MATFFGRDETMEVEDEIEPAMLGRNTVKLQVSDAILEAGLSGISWLLPSNLSSRVEWPK